MKRLNKAKINKAMNKQAVRYRHVVREYDEEIYDFDELSPEAKENAIDELRQIYEDKDYASEYMEMMSDDCCDGAWVGMKLEDIGIPIDNADLYWDWTYAWLGGKTNLNNFLKLCDYDFTDGVVYNIVNDYINDYENGLDFEMEYSVDKESVADFIDEQFGYYMSYYKSILPNGDKNTKKQAFLDEFLDVVFDGLKKVFDDFNDKVEKANKWLTKIMEGYLDPSDEDLLSLMDISEYEFDEKGYII